MTAKRTPDPQASPENRPILAMVYDFDGTLSPGNMQEYAFIKRLRQQPEEFWKKCKAYAQAHEADKILSYLCTMIDESSKNDEVRITREDFVRDGREIELFPGVEEWFGRVNAYAADKGFEAEHYIISSGLSEMIEGTSIHQQFKAVYACKFAYDKHGVAKWPALAVNYTEKTQYLFRINKGALDVKDDRQINEFISESDRRVPFRQMIYIGDGATDVPCMKLVKENGGHSIAVYRPEADSIEAQRLIGQRRVNFIAPADYTAGQKLSDIVTLIVDKLYAEKELGKLAGVPQNR